MKTMKAIIALALIYTAQAMKLESAAEAEAEAEMALEEMTGDYVGDETPPKPKVVEAKANLRASSQTVVAVPPKPLADAPKLLAADVKSPILTGQKSVKDMNKAEYEEAIADLFKIGSLGLSKQQLMETPFGGAVQKIKDVIEHEMMPDVEAAHDTNQKELVRLEEEVIHCHNTKDEQWATAEPADHSYKAIAPVHKTCRATEKSLFNDKTACWEDEDDKEKVRDMKCHEFDLIDQKFTDQGLNQDVMIKGGGEASQSYITRISETICGHAGTTGKGEFGVGGYLDEWLNAKDECLTATDNHKAQEDKCKEEDTKHANEQSKCDNIQDTMDKASCKFAIDIKDACEEYAECYTAAHEAYMTMEAAVKVEEEDRKEEWAGLKRMLCIIIAIEDGDVTQTEITLCKDAVATTHHLDIIYPHIHDMDACEVPKEYPTTAEYKVAQFEPLPLDAKGKENANECTGVAEISTTPNEGSPETCQCERLTINGPFSVGPLVKCVNCLDVRRSQDKNSCPSGTKLFAPRSELDWKTFIASAEALQAPSWIIDITSPEDFTDGRGAHLVMASETAPKWETADGAAWWLRSTPLPTQGADYQANCFLGLSAPGEHGAAGLTFNNDNCNHHAKSYYCQLERVSTTPKEGSPGGCLCEHVALTGTYTGGVLLKCTGCLDVKKSTDKNSCPVGTKIFSPQSKEDWTTFLASATPLWDPAFIVDVTRSQDGCGGCNDYNMNSGLAAQATWTTSDASPWWLRETLADGLESSYEANCYLNVYEATNAAAIKFRGQKCDFNARSYYCQKAVHYAKKSA